MSSGNVIQIVVLSVALLLFLILFHRRRPSDCRNNQGGGDEEDAQEVVRHARQQLVLQELEEKQQKIKRKLTLLQKFHCTTIGEHDCEFNKKSVNNNDDDNNDDNNNNKTSTGEMDSDNHDHHQDDVESQKNKEPEEIMEGNHEAFTHPVESGSGSFFGSALWKNYLQSSINNNNNTQLNECSICLEPYGKGDSICVSKSPECQHMFHKQCIVEWLQKQDHCPLCRVDLMDF